ncbi:MAG TPA: helix-turn-helix domain-containing protein [Dehalococcoidia bacterium]|nr:helix-turn-helix domain-containing protein [Dehalococcoidia bacterium]
MNIAQAADKLGLSTRTVRRYIKSGKIEAELVSGHFGEEYRILDIPPELFPDGCKEEAPSPGQTSGQDLVRAMDIIRELQEKNLALAAQLGVATERVRNLESKIKLLSTPKKRWWRRFLDRLAKK